VASRRRLYTGLGLFVSGALLTAAGVIVASTDLLSSLGLVADRMGAWRRAGVLAGLGVPAVIAGVFSVLPSSRRIKAAATIGTSVSVLGVALFWYAYPAHWAGYGQELTLPVTGVYFFGMTTSVWCVFVGIANFKRRNDPGGTVSLRVTKGGETKVIEVPRSEVDAGGVSGGVGVFGTDVDVGVETQTGGTGTDSAGAGTATAGGSSGNGSTTTPSAGPGSGADSGGTDSRSGDAKATARSTDRSAADAAGATASPATSDGGVSDNDITSLRTEGEVVGTGESARDLADRYCGNCEHFRYVRSDGGMQPYCGFHGDAMDDMEACEEWESNH
jgi:hypothetical protein